MGIKRSKLSKFNSISANDVEILLEKEEPVFVALASQVTFYSNNADTWLAGNLPFSSEWRQVSYGEGVFVAVGYGGYGLPSNFSTTSTDGVTWTQRTMPASVSWSGVVYGDGVFVAVSGYESTQRNIAATSTDGITWTQRTLPATLRWSGVTHGNGTFVAVSLSSTAATSTDGVTWTQRTMPSNQNWKDIAYGEGLFVAISGMINLSSSFATSTNGITWTARAIPNTNPGSGGYADWYTITHGGGKFVVFPGGKNNFGASAITTSTNGTTWTFTDSGHQASYMDSTYHNGLFVACGQFDVGIVISSTDAVTWTKKEVGSFATAIGSARIPSIEKRSLRSEIEKLL